MAKKKVNNYIIDEENKIVKIELNRWEDENLWVIIDLDDFDKIINFNKGKEYLFKLQLIILTFLFQCI